MKIIELATTIIPKVAFAKISHLPYPVWLDSATDDIKLSRYSFIAAQPSDFFKLLRSGEIKSGYPLAGTWDEALDFWLSKYRHDLKHMYPFLGGALGYISYDIKNLIEKLPQSAEVDIDIPLIDLKHYDWTYIYDHHTKRAFLASYHKDYNFESLMALLNDGLVEQEKTPSDPFVEEEILSNMRYEQYLNAIDKVKAYIKAGDVYQINFTQRFSAPLIGDEIALYSALRNYNPAPFSAYIKEDEYSILSSSPERFIKREQEIISTRPIKGTVARSADKAQDEKNKAWLLNSEKDKAELLMIVDLERNDLSKLAQKNSVEVTENFVLETYATVYHLVSTVKAKLREEVTFSDILKATFPGGSITGAPKIRAMEIIDELEPHARNIYTGSIGYISGNGDFDFNIAIRTILRYQDNIYYQVGGGIVWDSNAESEYRESLAKGVALKRVLKNDYKIES